MRRPFSYNVLNIDHKMRTRVTQTSGTRPLSRTYAGPLQSVLTEWEVHLSHVVQSILSAPTCKSLEATRLHNTAVIVYAHRNKAITVHLRPLEQFQVARCPDNTRSRGAESAQMLSISGAVLPVKGRRSASQASHVPSRSSHNVVSCTSGDVFVDVRGKSTGWRA